MSLHKPTSQIRKNKAPEVMILEEEDLTPEARVEVETFKQNVLNSITLAIGFMNSQKMIQDK